MANIKFISYTGRYPNLCSGVLTLEIDGEIVRFGHDYSKFFVKDNNYPKFWMSGGSAGFDEDYNGIVETDAWELDIDSLDERFWEIADELIDVFNENVDFGCCGGCL